MFDEEPDDDLHGQCDAEISALVNITEDLVRHFSIKENGLWNSGNVNAVAIAMRMLDSYSVVRIVEQGPRTDWVVVESCN